MSFRVGLGYDVHSFDAASDLILGGVKIPHTKGLKGHSDADVLLHAITDALLGTLGLGDIGTHFPDTDPAFKNADSALLLQKSYHLVKKKQYSLVNVDAVVVAEEPKLRSYIEEIRTSIAGIFKCDVAQISVKATTSEKMGFIGRVEGIAVHAVVLVKNK